MKRRLALCPCPTWVAVMLSHCFCLGPGPASAQVSNPAPALDWHDIREFSIEGKGWSDTKDLYDRLPSRAEAIVRPPIWSLSRDSAGLCVRFVTDATNITARWTLRKTQLAMPHMPATGVSGLDLYTKERDRWHWLGAGRPVNSPSEEKVLVQGLRPAKREFALYLPLYNGVDEVKIGVPRGATVTTGPERRAAVKPIVFYGTSIVQGGCASRPGMAYPALLGRRLDWPTINLGFSGNAQSEPEMARLLAELDPAVYVLDPLPNMTAQGIAERFEEFVLTLRRTHPRIPMVLIENLNFANRQFIPAVAARCDASNAKLREIHRNLVRAGQTRLFYVPASRLIGDDGEATVDGVHPTDLGFVRMADALEPVLRRALKSER